MRVLAVPCLKDNYAYLLVCEETNEAAVVDASEASPVIEAVAAEGVRVTAVYSTHHHWDHVGGNEELAGRFGVPVYGHASDEKRLPGLTRLLEQGDALTLGTLRVRVLHVPGHTLGAVAYVVEGEGGSCVFTGDTLFVAGCGRLFEGTPAQLHASLRKLSALPAETRLYCGHEYTEANLRFAAWIEPSNAAVRRKAAAVSDVRKAGAPTVPSTIGEERETNPFLRASEPEIRARVGLGESASDVDVLAEVRARKDQFRGA